eukprot:PhF_6_TR21907/c0_g1_i1/m.31114
MIHGIFPVLSLVAIFASQAHSSVVVSGPSQIDGTDLVYADKLIPRPTVAITFSNTSWYKLCQGDDDVAEEVIRKALRSDLTEAILNGIRSTTEVTAVSYNGTVAIVTVGLGWSKDFYLEPTKTTYFELYMEYERVWWSLVTAPIIASPVITMVFDAVMGGVFGVSLLMHRSTSITLQTCLVVISLPSASIAARRLALHSTWVMSPLYAICGPMGTVSQYTSGALWNLVLVVFAGVADFVLDRVFHRTHFPSMTIQVSSVYLQPTLFFAVSQLTRPVKNQGNFVVVLVFVGFAMLLCVFGYFLRSIFADLDARKHWREVKTKSFIEYRGEWIPSEYAEKFGSIFLPYVPPYHQYFYGVGLVVGCIMAVSAATVRLYGTSLALVVLTTYGLVFIVCQPTRSRLLAYFKGGCYVFMAVVPSVQIAIAMGSVRPLQTPIATAGTIMVVPLLAMFELIIVGYLKWSWYDTETRVFNQALKLHQSNPLLRNQQSSQSRRQTRRDFRRRRQESMVNFTWEGNNNYSHGERLLDYLDGEVSHPMVSPSPMMEMKGMGEQIVTDKKPADQQQQYQQQQQQQQQQELLEDENWGDNDDDEQVDSLMRMLDTQLGSKIIDKNRSSNDDDNDDDGPTTGEPIMGVLDNGIGGMSRQTMDVGGGGAQSDEDGFWNQCMDSVCKCGGTVCKCGNMCGSSEDSSCSCGSCSS